MQQRSIGGGRVAQAHRQCLDLRHETVQQAPVKRSLATAAAQRGGGVQYRLRIGQDGTRPRRCRGHSTGQRQDHGDQLFQVERFADMLVHSGRQGRGAVAGHRIGRDGDDGQPAGMRQRADRARGRIAVHAGHLHVHQHGVAAFRRATEDIEGGLATIGQGDRRAFVAQQLESELAVERVILHHQQVQAGQALAWPVPRLGQRRRRATARDAVAEGGCGDRLDQQGVGLVRIGTVRPRTAERAGVAVQQRDQLAVRRHAAQLPAQRGAIGAGHVPVEQHQVVACAAGRQRERGGGAAGDVDVAAERRQHGRQHTARTGMIVGQQAAQSLQVGRRQRRSGRRLRRRAVDVEAEGAAGAGPAVDPQLAAHQLHQALADCQAQPGTAIAPGGGRFGLRKTFEDALALVGGDADAAVAHEESQPERFFGTAGAPA